MDRQKYLIRLTRPVFQVAYVEAEGVDEHEVACNAFVSGFTLPDDQWRGRFNPDDYLPDVHCVRTSETPEGHAVSLLDFPLYCLLSTAETPNIGNNATQLWMNYAEPLEVANLFSQWIDKLINERAGYYEEALDHFEDILKAWKGTDQKVVPLKPPAERKFDIELLEALLSGIRLMMEID